MAPILESMGAKGAKKVDLKRLAAAVPDYSFAYLITVDDGYRVHTVTVEPVLRDLARKDNPGAPRTVIDIGLIGGRTRTNLADRNEVTLLWPPPEPGGYSLIVDGHAELSDPEDISDEMGPCAVVPTRALLHRNADSPAAVKGCLHDCIMFSLPA